MFLFVFVFKFVLFAESCKSQSAFLVSCMWMFTTRHYIDIDIDVDIDTDIDIYRFIIEIIVK